MTRSHALHVGLMLLAFAGFARSVRAQADQGPEIRIVNLKNPKVGQTVTLKGFRELGSPTFSRDGKWIAFDGYQNGYDNSPGECWIVDREGKNGKRLAVGATPRWMPDGKALVFMRENAIDRARPAGVYMINRDGTGERFIGPGRWPDPSPDGKKIVFSMGGTPGRGLRPGAMVWTSDMNGGDRKEIIQGDCPCWSPDGKKISFSHQIGDRKPTMRVYDFTSDRDATLGVGWFRGNWLPNGTGVTCNTFLGDKGRGIVFYSVDPTVNGFGILAPEADPVSPCPTIDGAEIMFVCRRH
jgi:Tol biopolymer transport system component